MLILGEVQGKPMPHRLGCSIATGVQSMQTPAEMHSREDWSLKALAVPALGGDNDVIRWLVWMPLSSTGHEVGL
ncbi:hypothetical protein UF78_02410 [Stutzerimonas stutzeri]|jgi:hypothetical protein|uniref:Uncharacterized protein n=1 Tax=Stutzerimonas stutzeri TaxID=316 RepID=A0A0D9AT64_STUST|nr:hypothetical protein UF78_02410 [Stutzerimonas stutzeri]